MEVESRTPISDRIGLIGSLAASLILFLIAIYSLIIDLLVEFNFYGILVDLLFLLIAFEVGFFTIRTFGKVLYYEKVVDASFEKGIYKRLEPVLRKIAEMGVEIDDMRGEVDLVNRKVATVLDEQAKASPEIITPGVTSKFTTKVTLLAILTMAGFLYILEFPIGVAHYATLAFYLVWWLFITNELKLFEEVIAWVFVAIPILFIPIGAIFLHALFSLNAMIGILFGGLAIFIFVYYTWALYVTKGIFPFRLPEFEFPKIKKREVKVRDKLAPIHDRLEGNKGMIIKSADAVILLLLFILLAVLISMFLL